MIRYFAILSLFVVLVVTGQNCSKTGTKQQAGSSSSKYDKSAVLKVWQGVNFETGQVHSSGSQDDDFALIINPSGGITSVFTATGPAPEFKGYIKQFDSEPTLPGAIADIQSWFGMAPTEAGDYLLVVDREHNYLYQVYVDRFVGGPNHTAWEAQVSWKLVPLE